jgi:hypothetical protein
MVENTGTWVTAQIQTAQSLIERAQALRDTHPREYENIKDARRLQSEIVDFLFLLGSDYRAMSEKVKEMQFVNHLLVDVLPSFIPGQASTDLVLDYVDAHELSRAEQYLSSAIDLLRAAGIEKSSTPDQNQKPKTGPTPRNHEAVAEIVRKYRSKWKSNLPQICKELDARKLPVPVRRNREDALDSPQPWASWSEFLKLSEGSFVKSIEHSLSKTKSQS